MTEDIGHFFAKVLLDLSFGLVFLTRGPGQHEIALDELAHLLLEFEYIPTAIATDTKLFGVGVGNLFDLSCNFVDIHVCDYSTADSVSLLIIMNTTWSNLLRVYEKCRSSFY